MTSPSLSLAFCRLILVSIFATASCAIAQTAKPILSLPAIISKPGRYLVKTDLVLKKSATAAITILADDVTLDLGGSVISHTLPTGTDIEGISTEAHGGIKVINGTVRGFTTGIRLNSNSAVVSGIAVEDVRIERSAEVGIQLIGETMSVKRCVITNTGSTQANQAYGLVLDGAFATASDNDILSTLVAPGLQSEGMHCSVLACVLENNRVLNEQSARGSVGIFAGFTSNYLVENNRIAGFAAGLKFTGSGTPKYRNNFTTDCATPYTSGTDAGNNK